MHFIAEINNIVLVIHTVYIWICNDALHKKIFLLNLIPS